MLSGGGIGGSPPSQGGWTIQGRPRRHACLRPAWLSSPLCLGDSVSMHGPPHPPSPAGIFPLSAAGFEQLQAAMERLTLNDASGAAAACGPSHQTACLPCADSAGSSLLLLPSPQLLPTHVCLDGIPRSLRGRPWLPYPRLLLEHICLVEIPVWAPLPARLQSRCDGRIAMRWAPASAAASWACCTWM